MKYLIIFLFTVGCSIKFPKQQLKEYALKAKMFNGSIDTIRYTGSGENRFGLNQGDLVLRNGRDKVISSGVSSFTVLSITFLDSTGTPIDSSQVTQ